MTSTQTLGSSQQVPAVGLRLTEPNLGPPVFQGTSVTTGGSPGSSRKLSQDFNSTP